MESIIYLLLTVQSKIMSPRTKEQLLDLKEARKEQILMASLELFSAKDYKTNTTHNLSEMRYAFTISDADPVEINVRFELRFVDETVNVAVSSLFQDLLIYPNSSINIFNNSGIDTTDLKVSIYNALGKEVLQEKLLQKSGSFQIDRSNNASDVYFATFKSNGQSVVKKLMLR